MLFRSANKEAAKKRDEDLANTKKNNDKLIEEQKRLKDELKKLEGQYVRDIEDLNAKTEEERLDDLQYQVEPTEHHEKRITAKFICDRGVSHEFIRHRVFSFAQESTRYCNYSKDKFGNELTFIKPSWGYFKNISYKDAGYFDGDVFESSLKKAESCYFKLIEKGWKPQQARAVLPNATKTELVMAVIS